MGKRAFYGGVHPPDVKPAAAQGIVAFTTPDKVVIPLQQHTGQACRPLVAVGDEVKLGQKIGEAEAFVSAPVHASVSGKVTAVGVAAHPTLGTGQAVTIVSDGLDALPEDVTVRKDLAALSGAQVREMIHQAGIVGMGGAGFPTRVKVSPPPDKQIDTFILNVAECEPYLSADHALAREEAAAAVLGLRALMKAAGVERGIVAIEDNKPDAVKALAQAMGGDPALTLAVLPCRYPQGSEKQLIWAALKREVPSGGLPLDVGVIVNNVGTAVAVANALTGMPLVERVLTVAGGAVAKPQNVRVRIGTLFSAVIEFCGGLTQPPRKVIMGGPMMGIAQSTLDVPVLKGTSGILVLSEAEVRDYQVLPCVRCGRCVEACPMRLLPSEIATRSDAGDWSGAERASALDCMECGACAYVCPSRRHLTQSIRLAKRELLVRRKRG